MGEVTTGGVYLYENAFMRNKWSKRVPEGGKGLEEVTISAQWLRSRHDQRLCRNSRSSENVR